MIVYICIATAGLAFLAFSMFFGGGDGEAGHAGPHVDGVDVAGDAVTHDFGDIGSWFSVQAMAAFSVGFGAVGTLGSMLDWGRLATLGAATGVGVIMAGLARAVIATFVKNSKSSHTTEQSLKDADGMVSQTILEGRVGEVEVRGLHRSARSRDGRELKAGTPVRVVELGSVLVVESKS